MDEESGNGVSPAVHAGISQKITAGQPGSKRYLEQYGNALVCVRFRVHPHTARRYTTVEIVVDEGQRALHAQPDILDLDEIVAVGIHFTETELRNKAQLAGARWDAERRVWLLSLRIAQHLGLYGRVRRLLK